MFLKDIGNPLWLKAILKTRHRLNLHILKNILMQKYLMLFEKYQLIWWFKLKFRCVYFALWSCLNKQQYWRWKIIKLLKFIQSITKKHVAPVFQPYIFSRISPEPLDLQKIYLHFFISIFEELSAGTRIFQIRWHNQLILAKH